MKVEESKLVLSEVKRLGPIANKRYKQVIAILKASDKCEVNRFKDHQLLDGLSDLRELHLNSDCLLVYKEIDGVAHLIDIYSHKELKHKNKEADLDQDEFEFCNNIIKL